MAHFQLVELIKPMLACDWNEKFLRFPLIAQPKADGVRGLTQNGKLYARSLKPVPNKKLQEVFGREELMGLDGELVTGPVTAPDVCRRTTSMVGSFDKQEHTVLHVFDLLDSQFTKLAYKHRMEHLAARVQVLESRGFPVTMVPTHLVPNLEELLALEDYWLDMGYEGVILRDLSASYKHGRSTAREGTLLRIKRFTDTEGEIVKLIQGMTNTNEAQTNELGRTFRSTAKDGKVPVERIGAFDVRNLESGEVHRVSAGKFTEVELVAMYHRPELAMGKILKYKFFKKGMKDKPRFPGALGFRDPVDLG